MHEVTVSYTVEHTATDVLAQLSPSALIEYAEVYDILDHETGTETDTLTLQFEDETLTLEFRELPNGYTYELVDSTGLFEKRHTKLTVVDAEQTQIRATTQYTFRSFWSFILDRLAAKTVQQELEVIVENLLAAVDTANSSPSNTSNNSNP